MRAVGRLATTSVGPTATTTKQALLVSSSSFCTSSSDGGGGGGGGGRGRGRGISSPFSSPAPGKSGAADDHFDASADADLASTLPGLGRGRGKPLPPPSVGNVFSPWMPSPHASAGRGRSQPSPSPPPPHSAYKAPVFFRRQDADSDSAPNTIGPGRGQTVKPPPPPETDTRPPVFFLREDADSKPAQNIDFVQTQRASVLPHSILQGMSGAGRGQTVKPPETDTRAREENRHLRRGGRQPGSPSAPRLSGEARGGRGVSRFEEGGRGGGERGRGRGRGRQRRRGIQGRGGTRPDDEKKEEDLGLLIGESFDENRLRQRLGEKNMSRLKEVVDEVCERVFPSEVYDGYLDALDTNFLVSPLSMLGRMIEFSCQNDLPNLVCEI